MWLMRRMTRPDSVVFVTNSLCRGGSESKTVRLANGLAAQGMSVAVAYLNAPHSLVPEIDPRVQVACLDRSGRFSVGALRKLVRLLRSRSADTLVSVNLLPSLYCYLAARLVGSGGPRTVASVNTTTFVSVRERRQMAFFGPLLRQFDVILFGAQSQQQLWRDDYGIGRAGQRSGVLYNGVDLRRFRPGSVTAIELPAWQASRLVIGTVGQFRPEKKQSDLVRALGLLRTDGIDVGAVIVGDGPGRPEILRTIEELGLHDSVELVGEASDVRPYLARMDVFVLPSIGVETFSNAVLEAMAMCRPIVATRISGMPEMLRDGGGVLYAPGDVQALAEHLKQLLTNADLRIATGDAARRTVEERFSVQAMLAQFADLVAVSV
jgi:glycosyltransferase involved in cell wall biosynthesis